MRDLPDDLKLLYATNHGDVDTLKSNLEDEEARLDTDIQLNAGRVQSLLRNIDDVESRLQFQEKIKSATDSQISATLHHETIGKISDRCADFAIEHGYQLGGASTSEDHACTLKPALGSAEAAYLQLTYNSPAEDGFSMEQVSRGLRTLLGEKQQAQREKADSATRFEELEREKKRLEGQEEQSQQALADERRVANDQKRNATANAQKLRDAENKITELEKENALVPGLRDRIENLEIQLGREVRRAKKLEEANTTLKNSNTDDINSLVQERDDFKQQAEDLTTEVDDLKGELGVERDNSAALQTALGKVASVESAIKDAEAHREQAESEVAELTIRLANSQNSWGQALVELLASNSGSEISLDAMSLILKQTDTRFASLEDFEVCPTSRYTLADSYLPLPYDPERAVTMLELLKVAQRVSSLAIDVPHEDLTFLLWLESTLLPEIHGRSKTGAWILLSFRVLLQKAQESSGLARCLAYTQLASLASQYQPRDAVMWQGLVQGLIDSHIGLSTDLLGQASLTHLTLTTEEPSALCTLISNAVYNAVVIKQSITVESSIQAIMLEIQKELAISETVCADVAGTTLIAMMTDVEELVFAKVLHTGWVCSVLGLTLSMNGKDLQVSWGGSDSITVPAQEDEALHQYVHQVHAREALKVQIAEKTKISNAFLQHALNFNPGK